MLHAPLAFYVYFLVAAFSVRCIAALGAEPEPKLKLDAATLALRMPEGDDVTFGGGSLKRTGSGALTIELEIAKRDSALRLKPTNGAVFYLTNGADGYPLTTIDPKTNRAVEKYPPNSARGVLDPFNDAYAKTGQITTVLGHNALKEPVAGVVLFKVAKVLPDRIALTGALPNVKLYSFRPNAVGIVLFGLGGKKRQQTVPLSKMVWIGLDGEGFLSPRID